MTTHHITHISPSCAPLKARKRRPRLRITSHTFIECIAPVLCGIFLFLLFAYGIATAPTMHDGPDSVRMEARP